MAWHTTAHEYRNIPMRSAVEVEWARFLDASGIVWEYEPVRFAPRSPRPYTPDFGLDGDCSVFLEVKGSDRLSNYVMACPFPLIIVFGFPHNLRAVSTFTPSAGLRSAARWSEALNTMRGES